MTSEKKRGNWLKDPSDTSGSMRSEDMKRCQAALNGTNLGVLVPASTPGSVLITDGDGKKGEFWIELAPPFTDKLSKLKEFVDEHDLLGGLDKKFLRQVLGELEDASLRITKFKMRIKNVEGIQFWTASITINNKKEFAGMSRHPADAFLAMAEGFEEYLTEALMD